MLNFPLAAPLLGSRIQKPVVSLPFLQGYLPSGTSFTRATAAKAFSNEGVLATHASGVPRFGHVYDGVGWKPHGLFIEAAETNLALRSETLDAGGTWIVAGTPVITANSTVAPDGTTTAETVEDNAGASVEAIVQTITVADDSATFVISFFMLKDDDETRFPETGVSFTGGTQVNEKPQINTKTGAIDYRITSNGSTTVTDFGIYWYVVLTLANNTSGNTSLKLDLAPARAISIGGSTSTNGSIIVWGVQMAKAPTPSSYIGPTITSTVIRNADAASLTFAKALDSARGLTIYVDVFREFAPTGTVRVLRLGNSGGTDYVEIFATATAFTARVVDTSTQANIATGAITMTGRHRLAITMRADDVQFVMDGASIGVDVGATMPADLTVLGIGSRNGSTDFFGGFIENIDIFNDRHFVGEMIRRTTL